jgi:hypothetical protein
MQLLKIVLVILLIYYLMKIILRYFFPVVARYLIRKSIEPDQYQRSSGAYRKSGLHVDDTEKKSTGKQEFIGEYIDFEEINE